LRGMAQGASAFPEPKKVKTVAVRADGSIISSESAPAAAAPQPPQRPAATQPASNAPQAASKNTTPKSPVRAAGATPAAPATPAAKPQPAKPPVAAKPTPTPKPKQVAAVASQADDGADDAAEPAKTTASTGGFAVQLAAPGSEAEARQVAQRLGEKFSGALGGRRPSVQKASDKEVYRVRVTGLSKEGATGVCEKIKAAGGACFVSR
jgi:cell division protein FtsN